MASFLVVVIAASSVLTRCIAVAVDDPKCYAPFLDLWKSDPNDPRFYYDRNANGSIIQTNHTMVTLSQCNKACGTPPNAYNIWDIQQRVATWIVPLFILIGSMHFVPLGKWNTVQVTLHLLADPINSFRCLLSKLATYQRWYERGRDSTELPPETRKDMAMIMLAYDAWQEILSCHAGHPIRPTGEEISESLTNWLEESPQVPELKRHARLNACRTAAYELADCRASGLTKTLIGTLNYLIIIAASLVHIINGDFNNRTGHSIAFAMLYSWLVPTVLLSSMVGGFNTKYSSKAILERLHADLARIEVDSDNPAHANAVPQLSPFASIPRVSSLAVFESLPWCGANYTFCPRQSHWGHRNPISIIGVALLPTLLAMLSAVFMSYTNPTVGLGCRSVQQLSFYVAWVISALLTCRIQRQDGVPPARDPQTPERPPKPSIDHQEHATDPAQRTGENGNTHLPLLQTNSPKRQWHRVLAKDLCILIPQAAFFLAGFCGWFNSCFCWSAWFSRGGDAYVVLDPKEIIRTLARETWPLLTLLPLLCHLLFVLAIWVAFRRGVGLFSVKEEERNRERDYIVHDRLSRASTALLPLPVTESAGAGLGADGVEGQGVD